MADDDMRRLLDRFVQDAGRIVPMMALWAHGSLAFGDFVPGRSDLDLVALIRNPVIAEQRQELQRAHESLISEPLGAGLHCSYIVMGEHADAARSHVTWAHGELYERPVSPVTRRELCQGGLCLLGPDPVTVIPAVTDAELAHYIRGDLRDYWSPRTKIADLWLNDIWVDLGMLTLGRAAVTLREGRLITKKEALDVLAGMGAPADLLDDIRDRRYGAALPITDDWRTRRAELASTFVQLGIDRTLS
jgi:hypothetical protein